MNRVQHLFRPAAALALVWASGTAHGQAYSTNFEPSLYTGSAAGTVVTGQDGWYLPPVAGSVDGLVFTYAGNAFGVAANPNGGTQFEAGMATTGPARAQHPVNFTEGVWEASWDCTGLWSGTPPAVDNIGSFSLQNSVTTKYFQQLMNWGSQPYTPSPNVPGPLTNYTTTPDHFHVNIGFFSETTPTVISFSAPDVAWTDIPVGHWLHIKVRWDFTTAKILETRFRDITAGTPEVVTDTSTWGWYLQGGPNSTMPLPTDIRLFAGGFVAGVGNDVSAWDNVIVTPVAPPASCYPNCDNSTTVPFLNVLDFNCFLNSFASGASYANCDNSTIAPVLNVLDFNCFLNRFSQGCSAP